MWYRTLKSNAVKFSFFWFWFLLLLFLFFSRPLRRVFCLFVVFFFPVLWGSSTKLLYSVVWPNHSHDLGLLPLVKTGRSECISSGHSRQPWQGGQFGPEHWALTVRQNWRVPFSDWLIRQASSGQWEAPLACFRFDWNKLLMVLHYLSTRHASCRWKSTQWWGQERKRW